MDIPKDGKEVQRPFEWEITATVNGVTKQHKATDTLQNIITRLSIYLTKQQQKFDIDKK
jgi:hypothetical protein